MKVTVEISPTLARLTRSPLYFVASTLTGISVSFAPLLLYWSGKGMFPPGYGWIVALVCEAIIVFVLVFYFLLGAAVARELRK